MITSVAVSVGTDRYPLRLIVMNTTWAAAATRASRTPTRSIGAPPLPSIPPASTSTTPVVDSSRARRRVGVIVSRPSAASATTTPAGYV